MNDTNTNLPNLPVIPDATADEVSDPWDEVTSPDLWNELTEMSYLPFLPLTQSFCDDNGDV